MKIDTHTHTHIQTRHISYMVILAPPAVDEVPSIDDTWGGENAQFADGLRHTHTDTQTHTRGCEKARDEQA